MSRTGDAPEAGFTLLELLVVMAVLGLMLALVPGRLAGGDRIGGAEVARGIEAGLRLARSEAMAGGARVDFVVDMARRSYGSGAEAPRPIPDGIDVETATALSPGLGKSSVAIAFHPNGSSSGGLITLSDGTGRREVRVDWLTGRVSVSTAAPAEPTGG